jgi:hypothetical protein
MADPASVSSVVNAANFVIGHRVNRATDSATLTRIQELARDNSVLGASTHERLVACHAEISPGNARPLSLSG